MLDSPCGDPSNDGTVARGARPLVRRPPFHVSHDGDGAARRRGRVPSQPSGQGAVRRSGLRPRGLPGRHRVAAAARTGHLGPLLPRRRRRPHRRDDAVRDLPGAVRQGGGSLLRRSPDAEPLGLAPARDHQPLLPHRDAGPARRGHRLRREVPRRGRRGGLLVRRGGDERRRLARGPELRRHPQAAGHLRLREQLLRDQRGPAAADGDRQRRRPRGGLRVPRRRRGRERRPRVVRRDEDRGGTRAGRRGPHADRGEDLPLLPAHLRRRRPVVPLARRGPGGQGAGPDHAVRRHAHGSRRAGCRRDRRGVGRDQGRRRRADRRGVERRGPRSVDARAARVLRTRTARDREERRHRDPRHPARGDGGGRTRRGPRARTSRRGAGSSG